MYNLKNVSSVQEPFAVSCCNANVLLDKVEYVKTDDGKEYLDIYYTDGKHSLRDRRFPVTKDNIPMMKRPGESDQQTFERLVEESSRVFRFIASKFCTNEQIDSLEGNSFKEFAINYANLVNAHCKGVPLYLKTVYNKNKYVAVPKAGRFLQNMSEGKCTLSYNEKEKDLIKLYGSENEGITEVSDDADLSD
jgi:hypothetical protein